MAAPGLKMCDVPEELMVKLKLFKLRKEKNVAAISLKIDKKEMKVIVDEEFEDIEIADFQDELPDQQPRYLVLSYVHKMDDGRVSYSLFFIYITPSGSPPDLQMLYSGTKTDIARACNATKEIEFRSLEEFTEEALIDRLKRFG